MRDICPWLAPTSALRGLAWCYAASTGRARTQILPVWVIFPRETLSLLKDFDGTSPTKDMGEQKSLISAAMEKALTVDIPLMYLSADTTGAMSSPAALLSGPLEPCAPELERLYAFELFPKDE